MNIQELTVEKIREGLLAKEFSATEIADAAFQEIETREPSLHAFLSLTPELARQQAEEVDKKIANGEKLPLLAGVPISVKDAILVQGIPCTAGSRMLENYEAPYDAFVVEKIKKAGALIVGKTNMDEFGMGSSTENSAFGATKNPHDLSRVPGGTSGGSAACVAAGECVVSLGEDTGGSIRQPASFCGVVGLKPTYGAVSRSGIIAVASSLDQVGPMGKTVADAEALFNVIRGKDPLDATSVDYSYNLQPTTYNLQDLRIGIPKEYFSEGLDSAIKKVVKEAIERFASLGAQVLQIELPMTMYALAAYYIINMSEISANLARYDGIRYGLSKEANDILGTYLESRGGGLGKEVKRRIMLGTYALSVGYYDAYYLKAQKIRTLLKQDFEKAFVKVDVLMGPVSPMLPFAFGEKTSNPLAMYLSDVYTVPVNLAGLPGISFPAGKVGNLPVGLQVIAPAFQEDLLFSVGKTLESLYTL